MGIYVGEKTKEIIFPLGGIGSGSIGLTGNGQLVDWEIFNRPNKGSRNGYSHLAVKAQRGEEVLDVRVLQGDWQKDFVGQYSKERFSGYGFGPDACTMAGYRHFRQCTFNGEFPIASLDFADEAFPGHVQLTAFNPFIPMDEDNSSIPAAFFTVTFKNTTNETLHYTAAFSVSNPYEQSLNRYGNNDGNSYILLYQDGIDKEDIRYGELTIATDSDEVTYQEYWYRGNWRDAVTSYWRQFGAGKPLISRSYETAGKNDVCTLCSSVTLAPGDSREVRFVLSWNVPNNYNYWDPLKDDAGRDVTWKNYYATKFSDSIASSLYSLKMWDELYGKTLLFKNALYSSTLPDAIIDAAASNLSVLKTATVLRLEDGSFYGWEGMHEKAGSCEGTCQHVWNYAYALPFLFPKLERSIRELEFRYSTSQDGCMQYRLRLPLGRIRNGRACVDGQMGAVIKCYREWKISGDNEWLKKQWPYIKRVLEFAWSDANPDKWDKNKTGVLTGRQHHTLDMELFGPSSWLEGFYLAALKAASEMAEYLGDTERASEYKALFQKGYIWTKENLFSGKYFIQCIDLNDKSLVERFYANEYWNEETGEIKYQIGEGSEIDQMCAQWHANILGLGDIFDKQDRKTALKHMYAYNFKPVMRDFDNMWRVFSLNDEAGTVICDYPKGAYKPIIPIPYCEETMTGFEYQLAGLMISEGFQKEGLEMVQAVRNRYAGHNRNPWNEIECGSNYARSMASYALLLICSGFKADLPNGRIGFDPLMDDGSFACFWSVDGAWGTVKIENCTVDIKVLYGSLSLRKVSLPFAQKVMRVSTDSDLDFSCAGVEITFSPICLTDRLHIEYRKG